MVDIVCELYVDKYAACCDTMKNSLHNDEWYPFRSEETHNEPSTVFDDNII